MNIVSSCSLCDNLFTPITRRQKHCFDCIHKGCEQCGAPKETRARLCRKCHDLSCIGKMGIWNRREEKPLEQVISEVESFGLLSEKQYAFGYVIGVVFGDGAISKVTNRIPHTRSDDSIAHHISVIYRVRLSVISLSFAERFASQWKILTGRPAKVQPYFRTNFKKSTLKGRRETYSVQLFNLSPAHILLGRYLKYLKHDSDLYELLRFPPVVMRGIVHGMIDSEGSTTSPRRTVIYNKRVTLLDVLALMLELLGYTATVKTYPSTPLAQLLVYDMPYSKCE